MKVKVQSFIDAKKKSAGDVSLNESVFGVENNSGLVHQVITTFLQATASSPTNFTPSLNCSAHTFILAKFASNF